jgi:hypothetical protein
VAIGLIVFGIWLFIQVRVWLNANTEKSTLSNLQRSAIVGVGTFFTLFVLYSILPGIFEMPLEWNVLIAGLTGGVWALLSEYKLWPASVK